MGDFEFEKLRTILNNEIHKTITEIAACPDFSNYAPLTILTTYNKGRSNGFNNPHTVTANPELFFISECIGLYYKPGAIIGHADTHLPQPYQSPIEIIPVTSPDSGVVIMQEKDFDRVSNKFVLRVALN